MNIAPFLTPEMAQRGLVTQIVISVIVCVVGLIVQNLFLICMPLILLYIVDHDILPGFIVLLLAGIIIFVSPVPVKIVVIVREIITLYKTIIYLKQRRKPENVGEA